MVKSLLIGLVAVLVLVTGATAASSEQSKNPLRPGNVNRLCVWVEQGGTPDTAWDIKAVKAYTAVHKVCIVGKAGKNGKNGKNGKAGSKGAVGAQGAKGDQGIPGQQGQQGPQGPQGPEGPQGLEGPQGPPGQSIRGPEGPEGPEGPQGPPGTITGIITVDGKFEPGQKTFTVDCPAGFKAVSGGFDVQGSVTASYRSNSAGDPNGDTSWTVTQTSGNTESGKAYVYCAAVA
jgi:hypothetical protein